MTHREFEQLQARARDLRESHEVLCGDVADLLQHLRKRMEAARDELKHDDVAGAVTILTGEIKALEKSFLAGGGRRLQ